jgi:hypothetical protein
MAAEPNQGATGSRPPGGEHSARPSGSRSSSGESPLAAASSSEAGPFAERPEAFVGAAFAGGFVFALLLKRLAR